MVDVPSWSERLRALSADDWAEFLAAHSGLPGPRANLSLLQAVVAEADAEMIDRLDASDDEYSVMCAAACLGARASASPHDERLRSRATDERWRVREGVVLGLQLLGDRDVAALLGIVREWAREPHPLLQRAAVAALCEPRLLRSPDAVSAALEICRVATAQFASWSDEQRRSPDARTLRQALGYCWSVVVAADPSAGLPAFLDLDVSVPDVGWIVRENSRKKRLSRLLPSASS